MAVKKSSDILKNIQILVLDDEKEVRDLVSVALIRQNAVVETAADGREGLQILLDRDFDVLVVDLRMRQMDGLTFLEEALKIWPWLGVVVITGYGGEESLRRIRSLGVSRLIEKPFGSTELIEQVAAEYSEKKEKIERFEMVSLAKIQQQLQILRVITESALESETLLEALRNLTSELHRFVDFTAIGVLEIEAEEHTLIFNLVQAISPEFLLSLRHYLGQRYAALLDRQMPDEIRTEITGMQPVQSGEKEIGDIFCIPIMAGGQVKGFLVLASPDGNEQDASAISFIYHIANHLSTIFAALNRMRGLAIHDSMTGLYNRLHLEAELQDIFSLSERYQRPLAILIMDLDHFKAINDTYGHLAGDEVLKEFAELLKKSGRSSDIIGRLGGEEFIVILPESGKEDSISYAERVIDATRQRVFCQGKQDLHITVSIGITYIDAGKISGKSIEILMAEADQAMYAAKKAGRNCIRVSSHEKQKSNDQNKVKIENQGDKDKNAGRLIKDTPLLKGRALIVDDDDAVRHLLQVMLEKKQFEVFPFSCGEDALKKVEHNTGDFDLLITDIQMPNIDGFELINRLKAYDETIICIVVSGYATTDKAIESLRSGAFDFLQKPFVFKQVAAVVERAMEYRETLLENRQYQRHLAEMVRQKSASVEATLAELELSYEFTLEALVDLLDVREKGTGDHSKRVRALVLHLSREMNIAEAELNDISYGALLHDIGKIGVPDSILLKPGKLTPSEEKVMRRHPEIGYRVIAGSSYLKNAAEIVYSHQEKYDGSGYPRGLKNNEICIGARIFSVIDAYDAMCTDRPYRSALPMEVAIKEITQHRGRQFDPQVVDAFMRCREDLAKILEEWEGTLLKKINLP